MTETTTPSSEFSPESDLEPGENIKEQIKDLITNIDENPEISEDEQKLIDEVLQNLDVSYKAGRLETRVWTRKQLSVLEGKMKTLIEAGTTDLEGEQTGLTPLRGVIEQFVRRTEMVHELKILNGEENLDIAAFQALSCDELVELEASHPGVLFFLFVTPLGESKEFLDLDAAQALYESPPLDAAMYIDFQGNQSAEDGLGAADVFPPKIREMSCFTGGDESLKRTSTRRIGLQGKNRPGTGFFDAEGYIPVFTGDHVMFSTPKEDAPDFSQFRIPDGQTVTEEGKEKSKDGEWDEAAYEKEYGEADREFLDGLRGKNSPRDKQYSEEQLDAIVAAIEKEGAGKDIVAQAAKALQEGFNDITCCWDWIDNAYLKAGYPQAKRRSVWTHDKYKRKLSKKSEYGPSQNDPANNVPQHVFDSVEAGDWLYHYNGNPYVYGDHSVLFEGWKNKEKGIAWVYSAGGARKKGRRHTVNLKKNPITKVIKPLV
jgi:hypothetical protein